MRTESHYDGIYETTAWRGLAAYTIWLAPPDRAGPGTTEKQYRESRENNAVVIRVLLIAELGARTFFAS